VLVSGGVLMLPPISSDVQRGFRLPYINGKIIIPVIYAVFVYFMWGRINEAARNVRTEGLQEILFLIYIVLGLILSVLTFLRNYSLIPILGVLSCAYLLIEIPAVSWEYFFVWMGIGLLIYFLYGFRKSKLAKQRIPIK